MKRYYLKRGGCLLLCSVMILGVSLLIGCGDSGSTGATGPQGPPGPAGTPGSVTATATAETCAICHGTDKIADIAVKHPDDPAFTGGEVIISNVVLTNNAGTAQVNFDLEKAGSPVTTIIDEFGAPRPIDVDDFRFMMADLVPAGTPTDPAGYNWGTFDTDYWERWAYERTPGSNGYPQGVLTDNTGGNYTYEFATPFNDVAAQADAPDLDHTAGASHVQRLLIRFDGRDETTLRTVITQRSVAFLDFIVPLAGNTATPLDPQRQFVTSSTCKQCHGQNWERAAHAGGYRDIKACVLCHSPIGYDAVQGENRGQEMQDDDAYASILFHKLHAPGIGIPAFANRIDGRGYEAVTFPQVDANEELRDCNICHNNDAGEALGTQAFQIDAWRTHPTAEICTSCHTDVDPINNTGKVLHEGGSQTNSTCFVCHLPGLAEPSTNAVAPIPAAHDITPRIAGTNGTRDGGYLPENIPEFDVTITLRDPVTKIEYPGNHEYTEVDDVEVRVTLKNHTTGAAVAGAVYTASQDIPGVTGGGLHEAYVQVYGPRARALPVLATDSTTDPPSSDPRDIEDEHEMFVGGSDPRVTTDSDGFGYHLLPITADMVANKPGTYMVRVAVADYGRVKAGDYHIDSIALKLIQIGTPDDEPKVAGNACTNCHGFGTAPFHDERHSVFFDTDQCLACHHDTGHDIGERVHGVPLANRVHAVHSANAEGDIYNYHVHEGEDVIPTRDWRDVTFPRDIQNCNTCHNDQYDPATNTFMGTYKTLPYMMPCSGCHVGASNDFTGDLPFVPGVLDHMRQNGGPY